MQEDWSLLTKRTLRIASASVSFWGACVQPSKMKCMGSCDIKTRTDPEEEIGTPSPTTLSMRFKASVSNVCLIPAGPEKTSVISLISSMPGPLLTLPACSRLATDKSRNGKTSVMRLDWPALKLWTTDCLELASPEIEMETESACSLPLETTSSSLCAGVRARVSRQIQYLFDELVCVQQRGSIAQWAAQIIARGRERVRPGGRPLEPN